MLSMRQRRLAILVTSGEFIGVCPWLSKSEAVSFPNTYAGVDEFVVWAKPKLKPWWRGNSICDIYVLVAEPATSTSSSSPIEDAVIKSLPAVKPLEPFNCSYKPLTPFEQEKKGISRRTIDDAIAYARDGYLR